MLEVKDDEGKTFRLSGDFIVHSFFSTVNEQSIGYVDGAHSTLNIITPKIEDIINGVELNIVTEEGENVN
jgi:hypothetical protein